jgi:hypothetical protein
VGNDNLALLIILLMRPIQGLSLGGTASIRALRQPSVIKVRGNYGKARWKERGPDGYRNL